MKRKLVIAAVVASVAIGGGTAVAFADDDARGTTADVRTARPAAEAPGSADVSAAEAIAAALKARPGTAVSADLDTEAGDDDRGWEVEILGTGTTSYDVLVDPATGRVLGTHTAGDDADDVREARTLLKGTGVTAAEAAEKATTKGFVTSVDLEADGAGAWEVETDGSSAEERDWSVALDDAGLTAVRDDAGRDETGDDD
ncbi:PepSY domain-containing protein [Streptomyces phaeoluteigriseus]|uniref:PepSY domain-containing protein n=1 Tax=Streptomyces phaeoluteigriseus TaxID=114686 RepID=A0ABY4Z4D0_9ACTN|nr:PepSY domain-containing protein [Streptomyces phaeoluteigriseus]USQ83535.1 PepSY domain-containing protein [Streptomyces phaeoluteigriseus]